MGVNIDNVINKIEGLFRNFNRDNCRFTVDYDDDNDTLFCNYAPNPNDDGYAVSAALLDLSITNKTELKQLKDYLENNQIKSRKGYEWCIEWGCSD